MIGGAKEISFFAAYCLMAAVGYLLKVLFSIWSTSVSHTATFEVLKEIRKKLLSKLSRLPMGVILDTPSGRLKDTIVDRVEGLETTSAHTDTGNIGEYVDSRYPADLCFCFGLADGFSYSDYSTPGNVFCNDYVSHLSGKV